MGIKDIRAGETSGFGKRSSVPFPTRDSLPDHENFFSRRRSAAARLIDLLDLTGASDWGIVWR